MSRKVHSLRYVGSHGYGKMRTALLLGTAAACSLLAATYLPAETLTLPPGSIVDLPQGGTVRLPAPPAPIVSLSSDKASVTAGQSIALTWTATNAETCTAGGGWSGAKAATGGTETITPAATANYTLGCTGPGGTGSSTTVAVTVVPAQPPSEVQVSVSNPGFESDFTNWTTYGATVAVNTTDPHGGTKSATFGPASGPFHTITGLTPNTDYVFRAWAKRGTAGSGTYGSAIGVKNFGVGDVYTRITSSAYAQVSVTFHTGTSNTSAVIFGWSDTDTDVRMDDVTVATAAAPPPPPPPPSGLQMVGIGCTTVYYIDKDCDGFGTGKKASDVYPLGSGVSFQPGTYTMGDKPDADDTDATVNTTASWQTKWGTTNQGMVNFLQQKKGFTNTSRIFYISKDGNDATAVVNDPTKPWRHSTPVVLQMQDMQGGAIVIRGGVWDYELHMGGGCYYDELNAVRCLNLVGSNGHPAYVMNYPGEAVVSSAGIGFAQTYAPGENGGGGYITFDGLQIRAEIYAQGDGISVTNVTNYRFINMEFAGWHQTTFGNKAFNSELTDNVFHDQSFHSIYFTACCYYPPAMTPTGDFDFTADAARPHPMQIQGGLIKHNVMYNNGLSGYEPVHMNGYINGVVIDGNIIAYSGGTAVGFQTGVSNSYIINNLAYGNGRDAITFAMQPTQGTNQHDNVIENNTLWVGSHSDGIRETSPFGGINITDTSADGPHQIRNTTIRNNIIVIDNYGPQDYVPTVFTFGRNSNPDTNTVQNNVIWSNATTRTPAPTDRVATIAADSGGHATGDFTFTQFNAYGPLVSGNLYADPKFVSASQAWGQMPEKFNLRLQAGSPAINAGTTAGAPTTDVLGATRGSPPEIGAYEYQP